MDNDHNDHVEYLCGDYEKNVSGSNQISCCVDADTIATIPEIASGQRATLFGTSLKLSQTTQELFQQFAL
ncbi:putative uncharacterized protein [Pseudomonas sp. StFLB209]|uniref:hypothetical protein n=1 Tax=Pseudomonas sp. StFLB209 TaxID=1028989 RepID=UPI0004F63814|nr:hypothetical protein [Pseudomonas sp. StFLB209]BAP42244.1 putative uncharacterized protein [Pseudomonas sp. StFLB209]